jgi:hypothetical protein
MKNGMIFAGCLLIATARPALSDVSHFLSQDTFAVVEIDVQKTLRSESTRKLLDGKKLIRYIKDMATAQPKLKPKWESEETKQILGIIESLLDTTTRATIIYERDFFLGNKFTILEGKYVPDDLIAQLRKLRRERKQDFLMTTKNEWSITYGFLASNDVIMAQESMIVLYTPTFMGFGDDATLSRLAKSSEKLVDEFLSLARSKPAPVLNKDMATALKRAVFPQDSLVRLTGFLPHHEADTPTVILHGDLSMSNDNLYVNIKFIHQNEKDAQSFELLALTETRKFANQIREENGELLLVQSLKNAKIDLEKNQVTVKSAISMDGVTQAFSAHFKSVGQR